MIEARGLSKRFQDKKRGEIRAVENVSFTCQPGKIYGLLGANGAGKTTTLRLLATILEPTDGTAVICGHDVVEEPEKVRASVGFLSTATALYPRLTAQELVEYFGRLNGLDEPTLNKRVHDPPVMIFDEPTLGLDVMTARTITAFIRECRNNGKTVIFSTHVMSEVEKLCDTIGIIQSGKLLAEGPLDQLRQKYSENDLEEIFVKVVAPHSVAAEAH